MSSFFDIKEQPILWGSRYFVSIEYGFTDKSFVFCRGAINGKNWDTSIKWINLYIKNYPHRIRFKIHVYDAILGYYTDFHFVGMRIEVGFRTYRISKLYDKLFEPSGNLHKNILLIDDDRLKSSLRQICNNYPFTPSWVCSKVPK